jgi:nicotinate-nucleotide adenylyltransferase
VKRGKRIGLMGGTFDPPHVAHLAAAAAARADLGLDEVWFVPAGQPPHKRGRRLSPARTRLALLRRALAGLPGFRVLALELERGGPSYTVDTLERLHRRHPGHEWWLVVGADMLADLPNWRDPQRVLALARVAAVPRPGAPVRTPRGLDAARVRVVDAPALPVSSTDLRSRVARGASIRFLVPEAVERYVRRQGLYRGGAARAAARPAERARRAGGRHD